MQCNVCNASQYISVTRRTKAEDNGEEEDEEEKEEKEEEAEEEEEEEEEEKEEEEEEEEEEEQQQQQQQQQQGEEGEEVKEQKKKKKMYTLGLHLYQSYELCDFTSFAVYMTDHRTQNYVLSSELRSSFVAHLKYQKNGL